MKLELPPKSKASSAYQPGKVYIIGSAKYRPGQVKLGLSHDERERIKSGKTWLEDVEVYHERAFLNTRVTETTMHSHFASCRVGGSEWFDLSVEEAKAFLERLFREEAGERAKLGAILRTATELGLVSSDMPTAPNTGLEAMWRWRPSKNHAALQELVPLALGSGIESFDASSVLRKAGLIVSITDGVVLFDFSEKSALCRQLDRDIGKGRWEHQVQHLAGFNCKGEAITLSAWQGMTALDSATIEFLVSRGDNIRFSGAPASLLG